MPASVHYGEDLEDCGRYSVAPNPYNGVGAAEDALAMMQEQARYWQEAVEAAEERLWQQRAIEAGLQEADIALAQDGVLERYLEEWAQ